MIRHGLVCLLLATMAWAQAAEKRFPDIVNRAIDHDHGKKADPHQASSAGAAFPEEHDNYDNYWQSPKPEISDMTEEKIKGRIGDGYINKFQDCEIKRHASSEQTEIRARLVYCLYHAS